MTDTLQILWNACGLTGLGSAAASLVAAALLVLGLVPRGRFSAWLTAAAVAAAATFLATVASWSIRGIEVDRSAEVLAAEAAGARAAQEKLRGRAAAIRFAEDTAVDQADVAGVTVAEEEGAYERAVAEQLAKVPAYRRGGRKERSGGKRAAATAPADGTEPDVDAEAEPAEPAVRTMPESQLRIADRFDRINRGLAWGVLSLAVGLVGCEWVRRFNTTFDTVWPLPLAGTLLDGAAAKTFVASPPPSLRLADFLAAAARKGESFIVFADADPLGGRERLTRFAAGPLASSLPVRSWPASNLAADPGLAEIAFETAWFGRGASVVTGDAGANVLLEKFAAMLDRRRDCRARARRTLDIVWSLPSTPAGPAMERLARVAAATNVRWLTFLPTAD